MFAIFLPNSTNSLLATKLKNTSWVILLKTPVGVSTASTSSCGFSSEYGADSSDNRFEITPFNAIVLISFVNRYRLVTQIPYAFT